MHNVPENQLIEAVAYYLKAVIKPPAWSKFAKTGSHKERAPDNLEWWYVRAAAVLKSIDKLGPIGVSKLRIKYGGKKNRGVKPKRFVKGSGNILRKILQQLEQAKLVKQDQRDAHKGRIITAAGRSLLYKTAKQIKKHAPKAKPIEKKEHKPVEKKEHKPEHKKPETRKEHKKEEKK